MTGGRGPSSQGLKEYVPLTHHIDTETGIVTITGDYAEPHEWRALLTAVAADPSFRRGLAFVRDLRASTNPVDPRTVVGIMTVVRAFWSQLGVRRAAIVTRPGIDVAAMVADALAQDAQMPLRAFTSHDDAMAWLAEG
jgi:hypothetical protein